MHQQEQELSQEMQYFWFNVIRPLTMDLLKGICEFDVLEPYLNLNHQMILTRYGCKAGITLFENLPDEMASNLREENLTMSLACFVLVNRPVVCIFTREIERSLRNIIHKKGFQKSFSIFHAWFVICFIHETDHMANGWIKVVKDAANIDTKPDTAMLIDEECCTWAKTCENVITPIVQLHGQELSNTHELIYTNWVECERNVESQQWKDFIAGIYGKLK